jgi:quercetin dioxygenase-like cupin family protein
MMIAGVVGAVLGAGGFVLAQHGRDGRGKVTTLSRRDVVEKLDGKAARVTTVEVAYEPGQSSAPHRHPGPIFGYVLEGELELALGDEAARTLRAGETFYEPTGILHRVSRNPNTKSRTRVLAVLVHPRDAKAITVPEAHTK